MNKKILFFIAVFLMALGVVSQTSFADELDDDIKKVNENFPRVFLKRDSLLSLSSYIFPEDLKKITLTRGNPPKKVTEDMDPLAYFVYVGSDSSLSYFVDVAHNGLARRDNRGKINDIGELIKVYDLLAQRLVSAERYGLLLKTYLQADRFDSFAGTLFLRKVLVTLIDYRQLDILRALHESDSRKLEEFDRKLGFKISLFQPEISKKLSFSTKLFEHSLKDLLSYYTKKLSKLDIAKRRNIPADVRTETENVLAGEKSIQIFISLYDEDLYDRGFTTVSSNRSFVLDVQNMFRRLIREDLSREARDLEGLYERLRDDLLDERKNNQDKGPGPVRKRPSVSSDPAPVEPASNKAARKDAPAAVGTIGPSPRSEPKKIRSVPAAQVELFPARPASAAPVVAPRPSTQPPLASLILAQIVPPARENLNPQGDIAPAAPESVLLSQPPVPMEITPAPAPVSVPAIAPVIPAVISAPAAAAPKKRLYSCSGSEVEKCSGIASLIMTPEIKARLIMKAIRSQCLKNKNYCQINGQEVSIALLALDQDRNEVFGDLLSAPVDICDLNSVCRTGQSVRTLIVNYALERKGFGLLAELMIDKKFLGTTAEEKVQVLQELTSTFEGYLNQAPDAKAEMKPILAKLFTLAKAADDFVTLDRLIDNELINLDEVIEFR